MVIAEKAARGRAHAAITDVVVPPQGVQKPAARAPTAFEARLYEMLLKVPRGQVTTYGALSAALSSAPRAVGQALRRNPFAPEVPCHRVVASTLALGGYCGDAGPASENVLRKKALLEEEGVKFSGVRVDAASLMAPGALMD